MLPGNSRTCLEAPFGEVIRATGTMAKGNAFRFSTKYQDDETDLLYYGYRYYCASTGRWNSRDPLSEQGASLFLDADDVGGSTEVERFVSAATAQTLQKHESEPYQLNGNDAVDFVDRLGLMRIQDLLAMIAQHKKATDGQPCDCNCVPPTVSGTINGASVGGDTVGVWYAKSFTDVLFFDHCIQNPAIYWWDCYSASEEAGWIFHKGSWRDYGWSGPGSYYYSRTATPDSWSFRDPYHLDVASLYVWDECNKGKLTTKLGRPNGLQFTYDKKGSRWTGPTKVKAE